MIKYIKNNYSGLIVICFIISSCLIPLYIKEDDSYIRQIIISIVSSIIFMSVVSLSKLISTRSSYWLSLIDEYTQINNYNDRFGYFRKFIDVIVPNYNNSDKNYFDIMNLIELIYASQHFSEDSYMCEYENIKSGNYKQEFRNKFDWEISRKFKFRFRVLFLLVLCLKKINFRIHLSSIDNFYMGIIKNTIGVSSLKAKDAIHSKLYNIHDIDESDFLYHMAWLKLVDNLNTRCELLYVDGCKWNKLKQNIPFLKNHSVIIPICFSPDNWGYDILELYNYTYRYDEKKAIIKELLDCGVLRTYNKIIDMDLFMLNLKYVKENN